MFEECDSEEGERAVLRKHVIQPLEDLLEWAWKGDAEGIDLSPMKLKEGSPRIEDFLGSQPKPQYISIPKLNLSPESLQGPSNWMKQMTDTMHPLLFQSTTSSKEPQRRSSRPRIKIAILDTGYDPNTPDFHTPLIKSRIKDYKSWVGDSLKPQDSNGHGTHATALLLKTAPFADVYIARIADDSDNLSKVGHNVAEAIKYTASTWQVNIIMMSFGFSKDVPEIEKVINNVRHEREGKILFFAAASNSGGNARKTYPARHPSVISVRSTTSNRAFPEYNPHLEEDDKVCFGTLGENVLSAWPCTSENAEGQLWQSGTSVATPIAAALAAFILEYVGASTHKRVFNRVWGKLQKMEGMIAIFKLMSSSTEGRRFYVTPWYFFRDMEEEDFHDLRWYDIVAAVGKVK
ncbi:hypothetical protein EG329_006059 [Mollisiaceae sp. DMI_Dod_QoI]|nr:hypothetical protein EG329_006059 [Helotiales sp. DMI_Dod_QoI]